MSNTQNISTFPFGPQDVLLPEPLKFQFYVDGDKIIKVDPTIGYVHRGLERAAELNDYRRNLYLCERICGICNVIHGQTYAGLIEKMTDTEIPERAQYLRSIWGELARLQSHLLWLGLFAEAVGNPQLFLDVWRDREIVLQLNEATNGHRIHLGTTLIGGAVKDIDESLAQKYFAELDKLRTRMDTWAVTMRKDPEFLAKTVDIGLLPKKDAVHSGAVGPVIRASGIPDDMRCNGYQAYGELDFEPITYDGCDVQSRVLVRLDETYQSIELIKRALKQMPTGPIAVKSEGFPEGEIVYRTEQPRGEVFYYGKGNGTIHLERLKIRTPTMPNIPPLLTMLTGDKKQNIPAIVHSIDPCISCTERITEIKEAA
ncbi:nickel-dependent hydrogenase large subunit [archaeon]|nr:nickel-dependent hydrogenase large subunit [archaeon]